MSAAMLTFTVGAFVAGLDHVLFDGVLAAGGTIALILVAVYVWPGFRVASSQG